MAPETGVDTGTNPTPAKSGGGGLALVTLALVVVVLAVGFYALHLRGEVRRIETTSAERIENAERAVQGVSRQQEAVLAVVTRASDDARESALFAMQQAQDGNATGAAHMNEHARKAIELADELTDGESGAKMQKVHQVISYTEAHLAGENPAPLTDIDLDDVSFEDIPEPSLG